MSNTGFSRRLRTAMHAAGLDARQLARRADLSESTIYRYLSGDRHLPRGDTLIALAGALGVSADQLIGASGQGDLQGPHPTIRVPLLDAPPASRVDAATCEWCEVPEFLVPGMARPEDLFAMRAGEGFSLPDAVIGGDLRIALWGSDLADAGVALVRVEGGSELRRVYRHGSRLLAMGANDQLDEIAERQVLARIIRVVRDL